MAQHAGQLSRSPKTLRWLRNYLKHTSIGMSIYYSEFWQKFRNPKKYATHLAETAFYRNLFQEHTKEMNLIFDVGANIGDKSAVFSKLALKVIAFEPTESLFKLLRKRFRHKNVEVLNYALGSTAGRLDFFEIPDNAAYNSLSRKHLNTIIPTRNIASNTGIETKKIQVEQIERFIGRFGVPDYIKIDVEGYEFEVLKGLTTPAPFISFEANLPDFLEESIGILHYLDGLASGRYNYNIVYGDSFLLGHFVTKSEAIQVLSTTDKPCVEVYAKRIS